LVSLPSQKVKKSLFNTRVPILNASLLGHTQ
jgi:hypothetical protein